jgi:hypothetical protein
MLYARPRLREEIYLTFDRLGVVLTCLTKDVHWFPQAMVLSFWVRSSWQLLFLEGLDAWIAKAEIYAPALPSLLIVPQIRRVFGQLSIVILHPAKAKLAELKTWQSLMEGTRSNCRQREGLSADLDSRDRDNDSEDVKDRVKSLDEEAPAWLKMLEYGATEYVNWQYPEYYYPKADVNRHKRNQMLVKAKAKLLEKDNALSDFFLQDDDILRIQ